MAGRSPDSNASSGKSPSSDWQEYHACPLCECPCESAEAVELHVLTKCPLYNDSIDVAELLGTGPAEAEVVEIE